MEKRNKKNLVSFAQASKVTGIPEGTLRGWEQRIDVPELQRLFYRIPGTRRVFVDLDALIDALESDQKRRVELAEELDIR